MDAPAGHGALHRVMALIALGNERAHGANAGQDEEEQLVEKTDAKAYDENAHAGTRSRRRRWVHGGMHERTGSPLGGALVVAASVHHAADDPPHACKGGSLRRNQQGGKPKRREEECQLLQRVDLSAKVAVEILAHADSCWRPDLELASLGGPQRQCVVSVLLSREPL